MLNSLVRKKLELLAGFSLLATIFFLPIATSLTGTCFMLSVFFYYAAGNWRIKFNVIRHNPVALSLLAFFVLFIFGLCYTIAPFSAALQMLGKYDRFLLAALLVPLFAQDKWRQYAINTFLC